MKMRVCRSHELTDADKEWLVECHKLYFVTQKRDAMGQEVATPSIDGWSYDNGVPTEEEQAEVYANE